MVNDSENKSANDGFFLPDFCSSKPFILMILWVQLIAFVLILAHGDRLAQSWDELGLLSFYMQCIAVTSAISLCSLRNFLAKLSLVKAVSIAYVLVWTVTTSFAYMGDHLLEMYIAPEASLEFIPRSLLISTVITSVTLRYFYVLQQWRSRIKLESEAKLQALHARIKPHFLFNSMNIIASLIRSNADLAEAAIEDLAELFRASFKESGQLVPITKEWELCRHYLRIETLRLAERLQVKWEMSELPEDALIPMLTMQPLLENAILHGVGLIPEGGVIAIIGEHRGENIEISISNPISKTGQKRQDKEGNQMALKNIQSRLTLLFGHSASLRAHRDNAVFEAKLIFPYKKT